MDPSRELQKLYESGIRFTVRPAGGCGYLVGHGDYLHDAGNTAILPTFEQAVIWLSQQVRCRYPDSEYAKSVHTH